MQLWLTAHRLLKTSRLKCLEIVRPINDSSGKDTVSNYIGCIALILQTRVTEAQKNAIDDNTEEDLSPSAFSQPSTAGE